MENNFKLDSNLKMSLNIMENYTGESDILEVIVKYNGILDIIKEDLDIEIEILSNNYAIITLKREDIYNLTSYRQIEYIELPKTLTFVLDQALSSSCANVVKNAPINLTGRGVIVGIIDSGINYTHKDFRNADGSTRILYIWDQTINGNPPSGFLRGSLYTREDINRALNSNNPFEIVPHFDNIGHGTAVAGISCGNGSSSNGRYEGMANESEIIVVKLGERGFARNTEIMRAIKFILDKSIQLNMPVAINISFGTNDGSHTGNSLFETYIDDMANIWKCSICVATGNEGSTSKHYMNISKENEEITIEIEVAEDLPSLYIVLFKNFTDLFDIKMISPSGLETTFISNLATSNNYNFLNSTLYVNISQPVPYTLEQGIFFDIIANTGRVESGIWKIVVIGRNIVEGRFDIWLPVTEASSINTKFLRPNIFTTLTIPSTANNVISVGGYNSQLNSIAFFSGRGFTRNRQIKPDIVAPAVNITTTSNNLGYDTFSGTSMASPFVAGACALMMEWGIVQNNDLFLYGERMKAFLRLGAKRKSDLIYPNEEWGFGSLCVSDTLKFLENYKEPIMKFDNIKKYNIFNKQVKNTIKSSQTDNNTENIFYSEDYIGMIAQNNIETRKIIEQYDFITECRSVSGNFIVLYVQRDKIGEVLEQSYGTELQIPFILGLMDKSALESSGVLAVQNQPFLNLKGNGVLIGIIDTGIDYTVQEFIYEDNTTKIASIWDQTIDGTVPKNQCFGAEYTRDDIDRALASENPFEIVPSRDEVGHGTKLASICSGRENLQKNFIGVAPDSELVVVKLRQAKNYLKDYFLIKEDTLAYDATDLILGIQYLYEKAIELEKPIAICVGLGTNFGEHNGLSILEQFLTSIAIRNGVGLCVCNGNEGNQENHALLKLTEVEEEKSFEVRVAENEKGFLVNIATYPPDSIGVNIISPSGQSTGRIPPRNNYDQEIFFALDNTRLRIQYFSSLYQGGSGGLILITFNTPSSGIWKINVYATNLLIGDVHAWLPISNFINEETYFLNSDPFYTVTIPATADRVVSVGGYNSLNNSFYVSSGRGPTRAGALRPLIAAPSVNVSCIAPMGEATSLSGTSAGAAITTGCAALLLEWGIVRNNNPLMNSTTISGNLIRGANRDVSEKFPNNLWGFGKLDILGTFENL